MTNLISNFNNKFLSSIVGPVSVIGATLTGSSINLSTQTYQLNSVFKIKPRKKRAFDKIVTRSVSLAPNLTPPVSIPPEHNVIRANKKKEYLLLENQGLVNINLRYNISDRKSKGASSNKRQLTVLYKTELNYFKKIINSFLNNGLFLPLDKGLFLELQNIQQYLKGSINNIPLEIAVTPADFLDRSPNAPPAAQQGVPGSVDGDFGDTYLKVIVHKFVQAYNQKVNLIFQQNQIPANTITPNIGGEVINDDGVRPSVNLINNQKLNSSNLKASSGLFALEPGALIFSGPPLPVTPSSSAGDIIGEDDQGRTLFSEEPDSLPFPIPGLTTTGVPYHFNSFKKLPLDIRFIELDSFICSLQSAGINRAALDRASNKARSVAQLNPNTPNSTPIIFNSENDFLLASGFYQNARQSRINLNSPIIVPEHILSIESRKTIYTIKSGSSTEPQKLTESPFIFEYFENERRYERAYVSLDYLGASLHYALLENVRKTHSNNIIYDSLKFNVYAAKAWNQGNGSITKKNPLQCIATKEASFIPMITGTNSSEIINQNTNLVFTAQFADSTQNIYFTNRFISCSAYSNQTELTTREARELWMELEKSFSEDIILSYFPLVRLIPAYTRGSIIQTSNEIYFRGAVSNSGSGETFPL